jgi:hypothetical protein
MSDLTLRRRIAALVVLAFLSVMGATVAAATVAHSADADITYPGDMEPSVTVFAPVAMAQEPGSLVVQPVTRKASQGSGEDPVVKVYLTGHTDGVHTVAFSPDGKLL